MITLAPAARQRILGYLAADPAALGLRFGVRRTGCSGWGYAVDMARDQRAGDTVFEQDGVRIEMRGREIPEPMLMDIAASLAPFGETGE